MTSFDHDPLRDEIRRFHRQDENEAIARLLRSVSADDSARARIRRTAAELIQALRTDDSHVGQVDALMREYDLSSDEGVVLMTLAEALLRIPDGATRDLLIRDKLTEADWDKHVGRSDSTFVNLSSWALALTGRAMRATDGQGAWKRMISRVGEPVVRQAMLQAMRVLGSHFVLGETIDEALIRARDGEKKNYRHSYDMLGEAARTDEDAKRYLVSYHGAIAAIGREAAGRGPIAGPGISIKLSALHPRYELRQRERSLDELFPRVLELAEAAKRVDIGCTIDAEEADRLDLSLDLLGRLIDAPSLKGWDGLGLAVQAYSKRALPVLDWLIDRTARADRRLMVRLVKGAYWDTEIKRSQEQGLDEYPVFTRKVATDLSYIAAAEKILKAGDRLYGQFATHNAYTVAAIRELAGNRSDYEFQRLHGMGEGLYARIVGPDAWGIACRVYAPVGTHRDLLAYLVRRLLENGANSSFVNQIADPAVPVETLTRDPAEAMAAAGPSRIKLPAQLYAPERVNSKGIDLGDPLSLEALQASLSSVSRDGHVARPLVDGRALNGGTAREIATPQDRRDKVGLAYEASAADVTQAVDVAVRAQRDWDAMGVDARSRILLRAADLFEADRAAMLALCVREAGKTIPAAIAELREAVDFLRYYAAIAPSALGRHALPGPTGETNELSHHGRGVFACISPWNFPLAIFTGQVAAALVAGNAVVAKPAEQTPLIAARAVSLLHEAGVPVGALALLPGDGESVGAPLVADPRIAGVCFTGSTQVARAINRQLAGRDGAIATLIAETGGLNAMIVDSSALLEQVVGDVLVSAFDSAGQRCSALRMLYVQEDVYDSCKEMLAGAMAELIVGDPADLATDCGPVIDDDALALLDAHAKRMPAAFASAPVDRDTTAHGTFFAPRAVAVTCVSDLPGEVFGPFLHIAPYKGDRLERVLDAITSTGYGLTLGLQTRIDETVDRVRRHARVGNFYVNRTVIGAVVGTQPFGGEGLSGTGPKAGGPNYLARFATERTVTINTTAAGGNASLMAAAE
ncbi:MAG: delta-pyrroline-5-carboxylate dehydrogenase [Rhodospirillales bacterium]|nr:delta-pyrroline-5-carboxylate dehydrogenase [Rhodospirillales bacterium]